MNRSIARTHCTARWESAQRSHDSIIRQAVTITVSSCPSPASAPAMASSTWGMPLSTLPLAINAAPISLRAHSSRSRAPPTTASLNAWRAKSSLVRIGTATCLDERHPTSKGLEVEPVNQPCGASHSSSGGGVVTEVLVVEETELKGGAGRLCRVGVTAERSVRLFQVTYRLPGFSQPPQDYREPEHNLGRLVRLQAVLERAARLLPGSPAHGFQARLSW